MLTRFECIQFEPNEDQEKALSLDIAITRAAPGNEIGLYFSQVLCKCQRVGNADVSEAYFVALFNVLFGSSAGDEDQVTEASKQAVSSAAWFHFQSLFALSNAQMKSRMPELPFAPRLVSIRTTDEINNGFNLYEIDEPEVADESPAQLANGDEG